MPFRVRLANQLDRPVAIHWHGVRLDNAMDGTSMTQAPVAPGAVFDYSFTPPDAGTYWYHPLIDASSGRERGLSGLLLVEEKDGDLQRADVPFLIDDWLLDREGLVDAAFFGDVRLAGGAGRLGNVFTVNGLFRPTFEAPADRDLRLRILNAANARIVELFVKGAVGWIVARDGQPSEPERLAEAPVRLAPGQRADLLLRAGVEDALFGLQSADEMVEIAVLRRVGRTVATEQEITPLPANPLPDYFNYSATLGPTLTIEGGEGGGLMGARHDGIVRSARELRSRGLVWSYSGQAGLGEPLFRVARGVTVIMTVDNISRYTHVVHVHGHVARVVERSGRPAADTAWGDTFECRPIEPVKIIFIADNPGRWLISSTIAEHFDAGAQTWFEVTA